MLTTVTYSGTANLPTGLTVSLSSCCVATAAVQTSEVFCRAIHMLDLPSAMFKPSLVAKALAHKLLGWPWGLVTGQTSKTLPVQGLGMQDLLTSRPRAQV